MTDCTLKKRIKTLMRPSDNSPQVMDLCPDCKQVFPLNAEDEHEEPCQICGSEMHGMCHHTEKEDGDV